MKNILSTLFIVLISAQINCLDWNLKHQITSTTTLPDELEQLETELNYKPVLTIDLFQFHADLLDSEISYDLNMLYKNQGNDHFEVSGKLYRGWLRYSTSQAELRFGLQKINFGPAQILRSLQWFDSIDPHDPAKTTEGVKAILGRYYFINNTNIWVWGIWGDQTETSFEEFLKEKDNPEFGSRFQFPFKYCDAALTYNWCNNTDNNGSENRFGFDARWDFEIGLWTEIVTSHFSDTQNKFTRKMTFGADYTFLLGNGLYILTEYAKYSQMNSDFFKETTSSNSAAFSLSYPISIFANLSSIITYNFEKDKFYNSLTYQRTYDYLSLYLNLFMNPKSQNNEDNLVNGNSLQMILKCVF